MRLPPTSLRRAALALLGLALAAVPWVPAFDTWFVADDFAFRSRLGPDLAFDAGTLARAAWPPASTGDPRLRPVSWLSWAADYALFGADARAFHLSNLLHHLLCIAALFVLARRLAGPAAAFLAALAFAFHPAHAETVLWASARSDLQATLASLLTLLLYDRWRTTGSRPALAGALAATLAAFGSKEPAVVLPFLVAAAHAARPGGHRALWPFFLLLALFLGVRIARLGAGAAVYNDVDFLGHVPGPADFGRPFLALLSGDPLAAAPLRWITLLAAAPLLALALRPGRGAVARLLLLAVPLVPLAPISREAVDRHLYLPAACTALAFALGAAGRRPALVPAAALAAALLAALPGSIARRTAAGDATFAVREGVRALFAARPGAREAILLDVPRRVGPVAVLHESLLEASLARPFLPFDAPARAHYERDPLDLDGLALSARCPAAFLRRGPDGAWREIEWLEAPPDPRALPRAITLVAPAEGATLDLAADPAFVFRPDRPSRGYRVVFEAAGLRHPAALPPGRLRETADGLEWRPSRGSLAGPWPVVDPALARGLAGLDLRWWVEGTDDFGRRGATNAASEPRTLRVRGLPPGPPSR
jgi:hypothetical protein